MSIGLSRPLLALIAAQVSLPACMAGTRMAAPLLASALVNVVGPVMAGVLIDTAGFRAAFVALAVLPLATLFWSRWVPRSDEGHDRLNAQAVLPQTAWSLLRSPVLGHERGLSASVIGGILGLFAGAVVLVRLVNPMTLLSLRP